MKLGNQRASHNVEDRRGMGMAAGGLGLGGIVIAVIAYFLGVDPGLVTQVVESGAPQQQVEKAAPGDEAGQFVARVLGSTEDVWGEMFRRAGGEYRPPTLVLYEGQVRTGCGVGQSAMGPFYCPQDEKLYVDLSFFRTLHARLGAPGDFARAYVIAHEVAHHVQGMTGGALRGRRSNPDSVRVELQADCYAGVWGHHAGAMNLLEAGDREEGLNAAVAIGDDRVQRQAQGRVAPEAFTHGSSEQRRRWLQRGLDSGDPDTCDTFSRKEP